MLTAFGKTGEKDRHTYADYQEMSWMYIDPSRLTGKF
jgi:hypothetical protein